MQNLAPTPHGIQIKDFLKVVIDVDVLSGGAMITLMSSGGIYSLPKRFSFTGWNGSPFARVEQATLTNCKLSFGCDNYAKKIWFFGASYLGITSADRWPYYLYRNGYGNVMIAGFGGMGAKRGMEELRLALTRGVPEYVVWCLGGNNADSRNSTPIDSEWLSSMSDNFNFSDSVNVKEINSEWLVSTLEFLNLCKEYGIKPVLATIPSNPIVKHDYKNEWVRKSGIRYIDFAASVGADKDINWYPEMMFTDRVHPTVLGAQAMYMQVLSDFPEVMQKI